MTEAEREETEARAWEWLDKTFKDEAPVDRIYSCDEMVDAFRAGHAMLVKALEWYAEQVAGCRKLGHIGDPSRHALDADGGKRAREALNLCRGEPKC